MDGLAVVDAYGADEQLWSFRQRFEDDATLPFPATIVGADVEVVEVDSDGDDRRGLDARVARDGEGRSVSLLDIRAGGSASHDTARLLAAYRHWFSFDRREGSNDGTPAICEADIEPRPSMNGNGPLC